MQQGCTQLGVRLGPTDSGQMKRTTWKQTQHNGEIAGSCCQSGTKGTEILAVKCADW